MAKVKTEAPVVAVEEAPAPVLKTVETWEQEKGTPAWLSAAARACNRWAMGRELTEADFDKGVELAANARMTSGNHFIEQ